MLFLDCLKETHCTFDKVQGGFWTEPQKFFAKHALFDCECDQRPVRATKFARKDIKEVVNFYNLNQRVGDGSDGRGYFKNLVVLASRN